ncbi:MAG: DinB family protein [Capsulimonadaceae bacterium]
MDDTISRTKAEYIRAKDRLVRLLDKTPEDKINWSPSPTARTPVQLASHASMVVGGLLDMLKGQPFEFTNTAELDARFRQAERGFTTREQALGLLETNSAQYLAFLDGLTEEQLASDVTTPFGTFPMALAITFAADHMRGHLGQIDYLQTIWGDYDWYA